MGDPILGCLEQILIQVGDEGGRNSPMLDAEEDERRLGANNMKEPQVGESHRVNPGDVGRSGIGVDI